MINLTKIVFFKVLQDGRGGGGWAVNPLKIFQAFFFLSFSF